MLVGGDWWWRLVMLIFLVMLMVFRGFLRTCSEPYSPAHLSWPVVVSQLVANLVCFGCYGGGKTIFCKAVKCHFSCVDA